MTKTSIALRAILALVLMVVFYALAIAVAAAVGYLGLKILGFIPEIRIGKAIILALIAGGALLLAAGVIIWSVLPRIDRFEPPGPELTRADCPKLFAEITKISAATGQKEPKHVFLVSDVNAFVTERGGIMGLGSQRVMGIGLPLLETLTVSELRGVLAHEFGHFYGGDTKLGPWIYKTRSAVARTVINLYKAQDVTEDGGGDIGWIGFIFAAIRKPFAWFGTLFMRVSQAVSRQQEYSADALSARTVGPDALISGLKKTHSGALAYSAYFQSEVAPVIDKGYLPPLVDGFRRFRETDAVTVGTANALASELEEGVQDPYDSHPPLKDRVAALEKLDTKKVAQDDRIASDLIGDLEACEDRLAAFGDLRRISWSGTVDKVYMPAWRYQAQTTARLLSSSTPCDLPQTPRGISNLLQQAIGEDAYFVPDDEARGWATGLFGSAITTMLVDSGYEVTAEPGEPIRLSQGDIVVEPFVAVGQYLKGEMDEDAWRAHMAEIGIADMRLTEASAGAPLA
jgi:Zn-dependent protease with chaperone function